MSAGDGVTAAALLSFAQSLLSQSIQAPLPRAALAPRDNPADPAKVALGRLLFWDPILSGPKDVACATCHHPRFGYAENRDLSIGVNGIGLGDSRHFPAGNTIPFVKRNTANQSPFDRYMRGDRDAMTAEQLRGMRRFERVGCAVGGRIQ